MPHVTREQWIEWMTTDSWACAGVLEDSLDRVNIRSFFNFFPFEVFRDKWPQMRGYCQKRQMKRRSFYDRAWSLLETGTFLVPPKKEWFGLAENEKRLVALVSSKMALPVSTLPNKALALVHGLESRGFLKRLGDLLLIDESYRTFFNPRKSRHFPLKKEIKAI